MQVIALIVVVLVILAVIIAYRKKLVLALKFLGLNLNIEAENEPLQPPASPPPPAGVKVEDVESTEGGLLIGKGRAEAGTGVEVKGAKVKDDIIIDEGQSGSPKENPPA